jgi:Flp pilus assembly protein TadB
MTALVLVAVVVAVVGWPRRLRPGDRARGLALDGSAHSATMPADEEAVGVRRSLLLALCAVLLLLLFAGAPWWCVVGLGAAAWAGARRGTVPGPPPDEVPLAADLIAACLTAGAAMPQALHAAAAASGPWLRRRAEDVAGQLRRGAAPEQAWASWLADPCLAPVARTCVRTGGSGAAAAAELVRVAARLRARRRTDVQQRVARASVWVVLPLGLCFLPAFVLVSVVPLAVGLISRMH